ncbi:hypothetical protein GQ53DRAFT_604942, partial [Thozetella sp. PMI_491]
FEALSYAWGLPTATRPTRADGKEFHVTVNLYAALRRLRMASRERVVWIDQLCINQTDDQEKSQQVALMSRIYSAAQRVIVWLGDED